jgi:thermostable 8-oxoguanine DNA glycosylase
MPNGHRHLLIYSHYYHIDKYLFGRVSQRFQRKRTLSAKDFYAIITWKANRQLNILAEDIAQMYQTPSNVMRAVAACDTHVERMQLLDAIDGMGVPIASAILTVCYPDDLTVLDDRAWKTLLALERVEGPMPADANAYFQHYLPVCVALANELGCTLRQLDEAMWGRSKSRGLLGVSLIAAAKEGSSARVRALLALGADPNARDRSGENGRTALQWAQQNGHEDIVALLNE